MGKLETFKDSKFEYLVVGDDEVIIIRNMFGEILFAFKANNEMHFSNEEIIVIDDEPMHIMEFSVDENKAIAEIHVGHLRTVLEIDTEFNEFTETSY